MALDKSRELSAVRGGDTPEVTEPPLWSLAGKQAELLHQQLLAPSSSSSRRSRTAWLSLGSGSASHWALLAASCGVKGCPLGTGPGPSAPFARAGGQALHKVYPNTHTRGFSVLPATSLGAGQQDWLPFKHRAPPGVRITGNSPFL